MNVVIKSRYYLGFISKYSRNFSIFFSIFSLILINSSVALASPVQTANGSQASNNTAVSPVNVPYYQSTTPTPTPVSSSITASPSVKLTTGQLRSCYHHQAVINNIVTNIDTRVQNQIALFSTIATRVEDFYIVQGKTLSNYSQLITAINNSTVTVNTDFVAMKAVGGFSCNVNNPKGVIIGFQEYLKTELSDLQNYRTAVKNLIVGVASVNGVTIQASTQTTGSQGAK